MASSERKLRLLHIVVQPVVVWDDGESLTPGPPIQPGTVTLDGLARMTTDLPDQIAALAEDGDQR